MNYQKVLGPIWTNHPSAMRLMLHFRLIGNNFLWQGLTCKPVFEWACIYLLLINYTLILEGNTYVSWILIGFKERIHAWFSTQYPRSFTFIIGNYESSEKTLDNILSMVLPRQNTTQHWLSYNRKVLLDLNVN